MTRSAAARVAVMLPPVRRLYEAINRLNASVAGLQARQDRMADELLALSAQRPPPATPDPVPAADIASAGAELDRMTRRELGEAALRNLPFLPGEFDVDAEGITVTGYCGAPEGITRNMAFFVNGQPIRDVEYPVEDPELKSRFPDVPGMGLVFRARIRERLHELRAARFWRFDAAPMGHYNPADWRRAIHYMNPAMERFAFPPPRISSA